MQRCAQCAFVTKNAFTFILLQGEHLEIRPNTGFKSHMHVGIVEVVMVMRDIFFGRYIVTPALKM